MLAVFTAAMYGVYCIPNTMIEESVRDSKRTILQESQYWNGYRNRVNVYYEKDFFTDSVMLNEAAFPGQFSPLEYAMKNPNSSMEFSYTPEENENADCMWNYGRYWHGYLVPLKLMLLTMPVRNIRIINFFIINLLFLWCLTLMMRRHLNRMALVFTATMLLLGLQIMPSSMQYMACTTITLLAIGIILQWKKTFSNLENLYVLFFAVGGLTSYMDFLTYPLLTLGMPAIVALYNEPKAGKTVTCIKPLIMICLCWGLGYSMIWCSKWILASVLTDSNFIANAVKSIGIRTDHSHTNTLTYYDRLITFTVVYIATYLSAAIVMWIRIHHDGKCLDYKNNIYLLVLAVFPMIWLLVLYNHTLQHMYMTWRTYGITLFALGCYCLQPSKRNMECNQPQNQI